MSPRTASLLAASLLPALALPASDSPKPTAVEKRPRTDRYGDPLPPGAVARLGTSRLHKSYQMGNITFSPDGRFVATTRRDCLHLWELKTGRLVRSLLYDEADKTVSFHCFAFTPDGKAVVTADSGGESIRFWDVTTRQETLRLAGPGTNEDQILLYAIADSPDGNVVACGSNKGTIYLWDVTGKKPFVKVEGAGEREVTALAFSRDSKTLAVLDYSGTVRLLWVATGHVIRRVDVGPSTLTLAPNARWVAAVVGDEEVAVWDMTTGRKTRLFDADSKKTSYRLSISPDGETLVAHELCGGTVALWDLESQKEVRRFDLPVTELIQDVLLSPDGLTLAGHDEDRSVLRLWDVTDGRPLLDFPGHIYPPRSLSWSADGKTLASGCGVLLVWDVARQQLRSRAAIEGESRFAAFGFRFSPGCDWAAWAGVTDVHLYDVRRAKLVHELPGDGGDITDFNFAPCGGRIGTAEKRGTARIWDIHTGELIREIDTRAEAGTISWLVFSPDGATLVTGDGPRRVHLWETATGRHLATIEGDKEKRKDVLVLPECGWQCRMAPDGRTVFTSCGGEGFVWNIANRKEGDVFSDDEGRERSLDRPESISLSADGRLFAQFEYDGSLRLFELASGKPVYTFAPGQSDVAFAPDGRRLATGCEEDGSILVWDLVELFLAEQPRGIDQTWQDLASADAPRAYRAIARLAGDERGALRQLTERLRPVRAPKADEAAAWLGQLDNPQFEVRSKATQRLQELREAALPFLERARDSRPPLEVRRRLEALCGALDARSAESLREIRAVQVLEYLGTAEARRLLNRLAAGLPEARLTREAQGALGRLNRRPSP